MNDLISRQAAIDAMRTKYCPSDFMDDGVIDAFAEIIQDLPTAQPEIIRCKDCIHFQKVECVGGHYDGCDEWIDSDGYEMPVSEDEFCSRAERRAEKEEDGND